ncbi:MAG: serine/threonine protein kinase [Phycisphaerales bacterium]|nr:serine/threonine protein kinase [Phycisphaerales bacterium]
MPEPQSGVADFAADVDQANPPKPISVAPSDECPPAIPDLRLIKRIGEGAFGVVWLAEETLLPGVFRAVKVLHGGSCANRLDHDAASSELPGVTQPSQRVMRELSGLRTLRTRGAGRDGLVEIHRVGMTLGPADGGGKAVYYVMDVADHAGGAQPFVATDYRPLALDTFIDSSGRLSPRLAGELLRQLLSALDHLHRQGIRHYDVKPTNLLFVGGRLKLADYGLATSVGLHSGGTPAYMPPETNQPDDLYAAGMVLYEMLTGLRADRFPEWPADLTPSSGDRLAELRGLMSRACSRTPEKRFLSARDFLSALDEALADQSAPVVTRAKGQAIRVALLAGACLAIGFVFGWGAAWQFDDCFAIKRYGAAPYDGSVQAEYSPARPDGAAVLLTRTRGPKEIAVDWREVTGEVVVADLQMRFESDRMLVVAGGFRFVSRNNPVAHSVTNYDPNECGFEMQLMLVLLGPNGHPLNEASIELLYWGQPDSDPGTVGRFFDHVPLDDLRRGETYRLVLCATSAVTLEAAFESGTLGGILEYPHMQEIATLVLTPP